MIVARIFPKDSEHYNRFQKYFSNLTQIIHSQGWIQFFSIWTLTVSGIVVSMDMSDRYVYWEWGGWFIGFIKLVVITTLYFTFLKPKYIWSVGSRLLNSKEILLHTIIAYFFLLFGYFDMQKLLQPKVLFNILNGFIVLVPYVLAFVSCLLVFQFTIVLDKVKGVWNNFDWNKKIEYLSVSVLLMLISIILGIYLEDPVISTAGAVSIPFSLIALIWPNHVRHLQRARFYPLFIFAMFACVRAPWFLIPLAVLFFLLRTINYFKYGIIYPSFGVDFLEED